MAVIGDFHHSTGVTPLTSRPNSQAYKSPYGPKYKVQPHVAGWTLKSVTRLGMTLGAFGGVTDFFALFFTDIPRVKRDIVQKIPFIGQHYIKEIPASDNGEAQ